MKYSQTNANRITSKHITQHGILCLILLLLQLPALAWQIEQAELLADDGAAGDEFGKAVSLANDWAVVGAPKNDGDADNAGAVYLIDNSDWTTQIKLTRTNPQTEDLFGSSVVIRNDLIFAGAPGASAQTGAVHLFSQHEGGTDNWGETLILTASDGSTGDQFGKSIALNEGMNLLVVGARFENTNGKHAGAVYVFRRDYVDPDQWNEVAKLVADDGAIGDRFGAAVAISNDLIAVGAWRVDEAEGEGEDGEDGEDKGAVYVFERTGGDNWSQAAKLDGESGGDQFGKAIALEGTRLLVGAPGVEDTEEQATGAAYVYEYNAETSNWDEKAKIVELLADENSRFGKSVALEGNLAVIGCPESYNDYNEGAVFVYDRLEPEPDEWGNIAIPRPFHPDVGDHYGVSVSIYNGMLLVGANLSDENGYNSGSAYILN